MLILIQNIYCKFLDEIADQIGDVINDAVDDLIDGASVLNTQENISGISGCNELQNFAGNRLKSCIFSF